MSVTITNDSFQEEVLDSDLPVLADFWAEWCAPCKMLSPVVDQVAEELAGKLKVVKVNVDENPELAERYKIVSIPTLLVFKKGEVLRKQIGAIPKDKIKDIVQDLI